jgi:crotonobetainyl-CoA:carnitine CoA-transferase CaiB-like acyl-CoA transferase
MERFDLGFDTLIARQPRLIQVAISGYGQEGPYRERAGHDLNYLSLAGIISMTGTRSGESSVIGVQVADIAGGSLLALSSLLAAIIQRDRTGKGQYVDVSMFHGSLSLTTLVFGGVEAGMEQPVPGKMILNGRLPCYGLYKTKDDLYMSLGALENKFWVNFCNAVGRQDMLGGQFGGPEVIEQVEEVFASRTQQEWVELMKDHDACCEPVISLKDAVDSELVQFRGMASKGSLQQRYLGSPLRLSDSPPAEDAPAPDLGQHTREVLSVLGLSDADFDSLKGQGVI